MPIAQLRAYEAIAGLAQSTRKLAEAVERIAASQEKMAEAYERLAALLPKRKEERRESEPTQDDGKEAKHNG